MAFAAVVAIRAVMEGQRSSHRSADMWPADGSGLIPPGTGGGLPEASRRGPMASHCEAVRASRVLGL